MVVALMNRQLVVVDPSLKDFVGHHYEYDRAICAGAQATGLVPVVLGHVDAIREIAEQVPLKRAFSRDIWKPYPGEEGLSREAGALLANKAFLQELKTGIDLASPPRGSIIFGHMITWRHMLAWARYARDTAGRRDYEIVLLLRYQPEFYTDVGSQKAFRILENAAKRAKIRIVTDSERLSAEIGRLTTLQVGVVPIPHIPELPATVEREATQQSDGMAPAPFRIVSLGGARDEKGILELIQAVRIIEAAGAADRFHFELQVNDPAPDIAGALDLFALENRSNVTLLREALGSKAYYELLHRADLVALPYWRSVYEARTSGVFLEAIAAAKPVVCTADTWMSDELARAGSGLLVKTADASDLARQLLKAEASRGALKAKAEADLDRIRASFNSATAIRSVLGESSTPRTSPGKWNAAVLYPWGDALRAHSGASLRTNLLARYLAENGADVRLLQNSQERAETRGAIRFESYPVDARLASSSWDKAISWATKNLLRSGPKDDLFFRMFLQPWWDRDFAIRINEIVRWADVVFLEYSFWSPLVARACQAHGKPLILTTHDVLSSQVPEGHLRSVTRRMEKLAMKAAPVRYTVSEEDKVTFAKMGISASVIPHPIDVASMRIQPPADTRELLHKALDRPTKIEHFFLFVGSAYPPNVAAASSVKAIAKAYAKSYPDDQVMFIVAGGCHPPERGANFQALGRVDDLTLRLLYRETSAALVPLREGTGASLKTIEAFAAGRTVVGTAFAFRGLEVSNEVECLIEETDEKLAEAVARIVRQHALLPRLTAAATKAGDSIDFHAIFSAYATHFPAGWKKATQEAANQPLHRQMIDHFLALAQAAHNTELSDLSSKCIDRVLELEPESGGAMLASAQLHAKAGRTDQCLQMLDRALVNGASAVDTMRARVDAKRAAGIDTAEDVSLVGRMFLSQTWSREAGSVARAQIWREFESGERRWIVDLLGPLLEARPDYPDPGYWFLHAHSLHDIGGDLETVARHFRQSAELGFDPFWSNYHLSRVLDRLGQTEESAMALQKAALVAKPEQAELFREPGVQLLWRIFHAGRYEEGVPLARLLLGLGLNAPEIQFLLGECLKNSGGSKEEALAAFNAANATGNLSFWLHMNRASLYVSMGQAAAARRDFLRAYEEAFDEDTRRVADSHARALLQADFDSGRHAEVEETCRALLVGWPENAFAHFMLAEAFNSSGRDYIAAADHYARAAAAGHSRYWCYYNRSRAHARAGMPAESLDDLIEAADCTDSFADRDLLAPLLARETLDAFSEGDYLRAVSASAAWCRVQPSNGEAHYLLAESLLILNENLDLAEQHYNLALAAGHNAYWSYFNRAQLYRRTDRRADATNDLLQAIELAEAEGRCHETGEAACDLAADLIEHGDSTGARTLLDAAHAVSKSVRIEQLMKVLDSEVGGDKNVAAQGAVHRTG
jgi:glycosyltransferase involved in cell wall biosynthesis